MAPGDLSSVHLMRREPYRLFFPLGVVLAWAGIFHWLLHAIRVIPDYRPIFHAMTQVQGFLTCMAAGFLFTMLPRRTTSGPPAAWQIVVGAAGPALTVGAAWWQLWTLAQVAWLATAAVLIEFSLRRFHGAESERRPPVGFVWIPLGLLMGICGALISLIYRSLDPTLAWLHTLASGLVLQGLFVGFVLGAGALALPLMTRDGAPPDMGSGAGDTPATLAHLGAAALLVLSFWVEATASLRFGLAMRAAIVVAVYLFGIRMWKAPSRPGWNARAIWAAAWLVPIGYLLAAALPGNAIAGLHVTFIGGFALLALLISTQVSLGHGGYVDLRLGKPWVVPVLALSMLAAIVARVAMELDPRRFFVWMAMAAFFFLCGALAWMMFVMPKIWRNAEG